MRPRVSSCLLRMPNATTATAAPASAAMFTPSVKSTAMKMMPTMSSRIARARRNTRSAAGSPLPKTASTPRAKAMSVAVGIGHPAVASDPHANAA